LKCQQLLANQAIQATILAGRLKKVAGRADFRLSISLRAVEGSGMRGQRLAKVGWLTVAVTASGWGQQPEIAVKLENTNAVPMEVLAQARYTAERIYAGIGVTLKWRGPAKVEVRMQFDYDVPANVHPGAMGYAKPYADTGTRIHILMDHLPSVLMGKADPAWYKGAVLGHVMAHELAHVLYVGHSDSGVMKARWDERDFAEMKTRPLAFRIEDAESIRAGVASRLIANGLARAFLEP
jgi:hypothetical protein